MLELPTEIWTRVAKEYSDRASLKAFRLTSSKFDDIARRVLFRAVLIRPNIDSFRRASCIAQNPDVACHVRVLLLFQQFAIEEPRTFHQYCRVRSQSAGYEFPPTRAEFYDYLALRSSQAAYKALDISAELIILIASLQKLQAINEIDLYTDEGNYNISVYDTFVQRYRLLWSRVPSTITQRICFENMSSGILSSLHSLDLEWDLSLIDTEVVKPLIFPFDQLKYFRLKIAWSTSVEQRPSLAKVCTLIEGMPNLTDLEIGSSAIMQSPTICDQLWPFLMKQSWTALERLKLCQVQFFLEQDLCAFLLRHRSTLRHLDLDEVYMSSVDNDLVKAASGSSVIRFLWSLRHISDLHTLMITRSLAGDGEEGWRAEIPNTGLNQKIQDYVCRNGKFPFPELVTDVLPPEWRSAWAHSTGDRERDKSETVRRAIEMDLASGYPVVPIDECWFSADMAVRKRWRDKLHSYSDSSWVYEKRFADSDEDVDSLPEN